MQYTVTCASGVIKDSANNAFAGLTGITYQFTVPETIAPTITTYSPTQGATGVSASSNVVLTFSENVQAGTGNIVLTPATGSAVTIDVTSGQVSISTTAVTINPTSALSTVGMQYTITMASGVIKDSANNAFAGLTGTT